MRKQNRVTLKPNQGNLEGWAVGQCYIKVLRLYTSQEPQGGRVRKLTEKGQELHDEQLRKVAHRFSLSYEKWKAIIKDAKGTLSGQCPNDLLHEHITKVSIASKNLNDVYEELRHINIPDQDKRRRVDTCEAVTKRIIETARGYLKTEKGEWQVDEE